MAYERLSDKKVISTNLNGFIQAQMVLLKNQRTSRYLEDETRFQEAVLADDLSLEDQLAYREQQLGRIKGDKEESTRVRTEIATIKDLIQADKFNQEYIQKVTEFNTGAASIDATISWLESRLASTTDLKIKNTLQNNLSTMKEQQFTLQKKTLEEQTTYALNDASETVLDTQIGRIKTARKDALLAGNDNYVALLDLQLQGLQKTMSETKISKALLDFSVSTITGQSAVATLNAFDAELKKASPNTPVTVGGVRYESAQQYWNVKKTEFLNDQGENGFFGRYQNEVLKSTDFKLSKGIFKTESLKEVSDAFDSLRFRPDMKDFTTRIDQDKQFILGKAADARATQVINQFATDLDATRAVRELATIQDTYGVDMTNKYQTIIQKAASEKEGQLNSLLSLTAQIASQNPGISQADAFRKAVEAGGSVTYSPEQLASKTPEQLFNEGIQSKGANNPPITVNPGAEAATFANPSLAEGGLYKTPGNQTAYVYRNGQLRPLAGQFSNEELKAAVGKTFADIKELPSFGKTSVGANLTKEELIKAPVPGAAQRNVTELVGRRPSAANPKVMEYYRTDNPSQGFGSAGQLAEYLKGQGYNDINDTNVFKQIDPYFNK